MDNTVEDRIRRFYDEEGWRKGPDGKYVDTSRWGHTSVAHLEQGWSAVARIAQVFCQPGQLFLNCGPGPFTAAAMSYSEGFERRLCVDLSMLALEQCRGKLGAGGHYLCCSMVRLGLKDDVSDGTLCEHVLYHVDKALQETAVREMIRVTRPGRPIVIIYSNPLAPLNVVENFLRMLRLDKLFGGGKLYFFRHRLGWWARFEDSCQVQIQPFNPISARQAKVLLCHEALARPFFACCRWLEARFPGLAVRLWGYPFIVLTKREAGTP